MTHSATLEEQIEKAEQQTHLKKDGMVEAAIILSSHGNTLVVDDSNPADIVKANPRPAFTGKVEVANPQLQHQVIITEPTPVTDEELDQSVRGEDNGSAVNESNLAILLNGKTLVKEVVEQKQKEAINGTTTGTTK